MRISRELAIKINYFIDSFIPPFIRDSDLIAKILFKLIYRSEFDIFFSFKKNVLNYSYKRYDEIYKRIKKHYLQRKTNLNNKCLKKILENVKGKSVIDVGCGDGYLIRMLDNKYKIVGCDILIDDLVEKFNSNIKLVKARLEKLPFKSKSFDTVICTHTLEHIPDVISAINELKRITKKRL